MPPFRIGFLPAGDEDTASSRIRVHGLARALRGEGVQATIGVRRDLDVLVVQKRLTDEILGTALAVRRCGALLVYDVDDLGDALWWWASPKLVEAMMAVADLVVTATPEQRTLLQQHYGLERVAVIPCAADYDPPGPARAIAQRAVPLRILWFGNSPSFDLLAPYLEPLRELADVELVVVLDESTICRRAVDHPGVTFIAWSRETFVSVLRSCHLTCLMHDGDDYDRAKSNNRMTTSIVWGVPAIVSRTPDYERTARQAGIEHALFDAPEDFGGVVERLRPGVARSSYLAVAQPRIWSLYAPHVVARSFLGLVRAAA